MSVMLMAFDGLNLARDFSLAPLLMSTPSRNKHHLHRPTK
jgi:hypothetical protein